MKRLVWLAAHLALGLTANAQNWKACGLGTIGPTAVQTLYGDSVSDRLLAAGSFLYIKNAYDTVLSVGQAAWNGSRWDSLAHRVQAITGNTAQPTHWFLRFESDLYTCGRWGFHVEPDTNNAALARLNETTMRWEALECLNPTFGGLSTLVPKEPQGTLYATGYTGSICGYPESCVFRYDGSAFHIWEPFEQIPAESDNYVGSIFEFQGLTYMTGSYQDPLSTGNSTFMRFDGTSWEYVPGWNTQSPIKEISIHNDTLYVAGAFRESQGGPGNLIAGFDGENWFTLGSGLLYPAAPPSSVAFDIEWFHGELYVSGLFREAGGVHVESIAKWDGHQWCGLMETVEGNGIWSYATITDMTIWRDSLYICGGFSMIDGDTIRNVAQWIGGDYTANCSSVGLAVHQPLTPFSVAPNPASTNITLQGMPPTATALVVFDLFGRTVLRSNEPTKVLNVESLPIGTYMVRVHDAQHQPLGLARFVRY